jgi:hypothetical protein
MAHDLPFFEYYFPIELIKINSLKIIITVCFENANSAVL